MQEYQQRMMAAVKDVTIKLSMNYIVVNLVSLGLEIYKWSMYYLIVFAKIKHGQFNKTFGVSVYHQVSCLQNLLNNTFLNVYSPTETAFTAVYMIP